MTLHFPCHSCESGNLCLIVLVNNGKYYVYILSSISGVLYIGITNNLIKRVYEHKQYLVASFTQKYRVHKLVYFEEYSDVKEALVREKKLKHWKREWKLELIKKSNPEMKDLYREITK